MNNTIAVIIEHLNGSVADLAYEMLGKARTLAAESGGSVLAVLPGYAVEPLAQSLGAADRVLVIDDELLHHFTPQTYVSVLVPVLQEHRPRTVLIGSTSMGLDLAAALSVRLDVPMIASCTGIRLDGDTATVTSQQYGGKLNIEVQVTADAFIAQVLPGVFHMEDGMRDGAPAIETKEANLSPELFRMRFENYIEPEAGDIDITQAPVLVSVGRGIQTEDNIPLARDLADCLEGALSSSRPIVDQNWLPITRQVGKSGMTVKPKLYLALGISGAPEHVEGMKGAELIISINTDPQAPIFSVAHYGVNADLFDVVPALTEKLRELRQ